MERANDPTSRRDATTDGPATSLPKARFRLVPGVAGQYPLEPQRKGRTMNANEAKERIHNALGLIQDVMERNLSYLEARNALDDNHLQCARGGLISAEAVLKRAAKELEPERANHD